MGTVFNQNSGGGFCWHSVQTKPHLRAIWGKRRGWRWSQKVCRLKSENLGKLTRF